MTDDPKAKIEELLKTWMISGDMNTGEAVYPEREVRELGALATSLAEKLKASEAERHAALKEMAKARDSAMDAQGDRDVDRIIGMEYADGREGAFRAVYDRARKLERELRKGREAHAATKREIEQERKRRDGAEALHGFLSRTGELIVRRLRDADCRDTAYRLEVFLVGAELLPNKRPPAEPMAEGLCPAFKPGDEVIGKDDRGEEFQGTVLWCGTGEGACAGVEDDDGIEWDFDVGALRLAQPKPTEDAACSSCFGMGETTRLVGKLCQKSVEDPCSVCNGTGKATGGENAK